MKLLGMTNVECRLTNGGFASLNQFKMDRSTIDSRQAEYLKSKIQNLLLEVSFIWSQKTWSSGPGQS
ncbi:hypothetical protein D1AOALGA4SA_1 [Olavius algarvensis Delta 1 endosymbiont]|nr:hypothetical protein D1AOALGA4SA_1 [Olavius algarvensis Delta 1 endosymbiont]